MRRPSPQVGWRQIPIRVRRRWVTSTTTPDTAPNEAFIADQDGISDKVLDSPPIPISSAAAQMSFRNNFNTEFSGGVYWDGGVLEVSSPNINGGTFTDITDPAVGGSFVSGGYTGKSRHRQQSAGGPNGVEWQFGRLHQHGGEPGTERERTNDQAALPHGNRRSRGRSRVAH